MSSVRRPLAVLAAAAGILALAAPAAAASPSHNGHHDNGKFGVHQVNLVSDVPGKASITDPDLVNPWGLALLPTSPLWSANNGAWKLSRSRRNQTAESIAGKVRPARAERSGSR